MATNRELIYEKGEKIVQLKGKLLNTDYVAIKYAEGEFTEAEFAPIREQRREWRAEINALEAEIEAMKQ